MSSQQTPVFLRNYCPYCDKELSDPTRFINHLNKVKKFGIPLKGQCKRRSKTYDCISIKAKSKAQSLLKTCRPSCCEHFPVNLPREILQDHFREASLLKPDNK